MLLSPSTSLLLLAASLTVNASSNPMPFSPIQVPPQAIQTPPPQTFHYEIPNTSLTLAGSWTASNPSIHKLNEPSVFFALSEIRTRMNIHILRSGDGPLFLADNPIIRFMPRSEHNIVIDSYNGLVTYGEVVSVTNGMWTVFKDVIGFWDVQAEVLRGGEEQAVGWFHTERAGGMESGACGGVGGNGSVAGLLGVDCKNVNGTAESEEGIGMIVLSR